MNDTLFRSKGKNIYIFYSRLNLWYSNLNTMFLVWKNPSTKESWHGNKIYILFSHTLEGQREIRFRLCNKNEICGFFYLQSFFYIWKRWRLFILIIFSLCTLLWRRKWQHTPVFLPGKSHRQRSLVGYSLWCCKESDMTERLNMHGPFLLSAQRYIHIFQRPSLSLPFTLMIQLVSH